VQSRLAESLERVEGVLNLKVPISQLVQHELDLALANHAPVSNGVTLLAVVPRLEYHREGAAGSGGTQS